MIPGLAPARPTAHPPFPVYRDGIRLGGVQTLRQIRTTQVREIQFMEGSQATQRFGIDHGLRRNPGDLALIAWATPSYDEPCCTR